MKEDGKEQNGSASSTSSKKLEKKQQAFVSLRTALDTTWSGLTRAQQRRHRFSPGLFATWSIWDHIERCQEVSDGTAPTASELHDSALQTINARGVDAKAIFDSQGIDATTYFTTVETSLSQPGEFSPTCAILGGVLSQDVLNALGGREEPLVNWFQLEGMTGTCAQGRLSAGQGID